MRFGASSETAVQSRTVLVVLMAIAAAGPGALDAMSIGRMKAKTTLMFGDEQKDGQVVTAVVGQDAVLECEASGYPTPTIHWLHNGVRIVQGADRDVLDDEATFETHGAAAASDEKGFVTLGSTHSRLYVDCVKPIDAGAYSCVAETPTKRIVSKTILEVEKSSESSKQGRGSGVCVNKRRTASGGSAAARVYMWTVHRLDLEGNDVQLFCRAAGSPRPTITWFDSNDRQITPEDDQYTLLPNGDLLIRDITFELNMGMYRCEATNEAGSDSSETFLYPTTLN